MSAARKRIKGRHLRFLHGKVCYQWRNGKQCLICTSEYVISTHCQPYHDSGMMVVTDSRGTRYAVKQRV